MKAVGAVALLVAAACRVGPKSAPLTPVPLQGPRAEFPSGAVYRLEVARTPEEHAQGLMFRESLPPQTGMIFSYPDNAPHRFWMKNTMIPLDMIWMDGAGKVLFISENTPPCLADPCPSYGPDLPSVMVIEIAGGMAKKEGAVVGSRIALRDIPPRPTPASLSPSPGA